ncbi:MAG: FHA domain-containing protein [Gammaproteobacteria bacterium]|nr:FHA domain-containing protein [Gammaproteobacteria bacterium]
MRSGDLLGQAHPESPAQIQLPATLTDVAYVHRRHGRFVQENGQWWLQIVDQAELGGAFTNPSWLNGVRLQPGERRPLGHGDDLRLAGVTLLLSLESSLESTLESGA